LLDKAIRQALYCDHKNAFVSNREPTVEEQLAGIEPQSHFEKACGKLGIEVIAANRPKAGWSGTMPSTRTGS
jgi:hypothetical protein